MVSQALRELSAPLLRGQFVLWLAFATTPLSTLVIGFILSMSRPERTSTVEFVLTIAAMLIAVVAYGQLRRLGSEERIRHYLQQEIPLERMATPRSGATNDGLLVKLRSLSEAELPLYRLLLHYQKDLVIALAVAEVVPMIGLVHCVLTGRFPVVIPYVLVALILQISGRPRGQSLMNRAESIRYLA